MITPQSIDRPVPIDGRLLTRGRSARRYLAVAIVLGLATAVVVVAEALLLANVIARVFLGNERLDDVLTEVVALGVVYAIRAGLNWGRTVAAHRGGTKVVSSLRLLLTRHVVDHGPSLREGRSTGDLVAVVGPGLEGLETYFSRYLPQVALAALVPITIVVWVACNDWVSAALFAITVPLIPLFMVLIGSMAQQRTAQRWRKLEYLTGRFLDLLQGLPTLRVFGRAYDHVAEVERVSDEYRRETMATLRIAFLSALVLELAATMSTALVAVGIGLRVLSDNLAFEPALAVLILAPEVYLPLRRVAVEFHASMEGAEAAQRVFSVLDSDSGVASGGTEVDLSTATIRFESVRYTYADRTAPPGSDLIPALNGLDLEIRPMERLAVVGRSGAGKSTLFSVLLRFADPQHGLVTAAGIDLADIDATSWRSQIAWVGQDPYLFTGSIADNIRFGFEDATSEEIKAAARAAGVAEFCDDRAEGLDTPIGEQGLRLSAGQRRRIALARALVRPAALFLVDEPAANLDPGTQAIVRRALDNLTGVKTIITIAHQTQFAMDADRVVVIDSGRVVSDGNLYGSQS